MSNDVSEAKKAVIDAEAIATEMIQKYIDSAAVLDDSKRNKWANVAISHAENDTIIKANAPIELNTAFIPTLKAIGDAISQLRSAETHLHHVSNP